MVQKAILTQEEAGEKIVNQNYLKNVTTNSIYIPDWKTDYALKMYGIICVGDIVLGGAVIGGDVYIGGTVIKGSLYLDSAEIEGNLTLSGISVGAILTLKTRL